MKRWIHSYVPFLIFYVLGICLFDFLEWPSRILIIVCPILLIFLHRKIGIFVMFLSLVFFAGVFARQWHEWKFENKVRAVEPYVGKWIQLEGTVDNHPIPSNKGYSYVLLSDRIQVRDQSFPEHFRIQVLSRSFQSPQKGDRVLLHTKLNVVEKFKDISKIKDIAAHALVFGDSRWTLLHSKGLLSTRLRDVIFDRAKVYLSPLSYTYFRAMLFGDQGMLDQTTIARLKETGLLHLFVVSGSHIVYVWSFGFWMFWFLMVWFPYFHRKKNFFLWVELGAIIYVFAFLQIINPPISTFRAVGSMILFLLLKCIQRRQNPLWSLGIVFFWILILNPLYLFDISTQLTFMSVTGILFAMEMVRKKFLNDEEKKPIRNKIIQPVAICLGAGIFTMPVLYFHFGTLYPLSIVYNLILMPTLGGLVSLVSVFGLFIGLIPIEKFQFILFWILNYLYRIFDQIIFWRPSWNWISFSNPLLLSTSGVYWIVAGAFVGTAFIIAHHLFKKTVF